MKHFETAILAFELMLVALPAVRAADTTCPPNPSPGSTVNGNLIVPANASCTVTSTLTVTNNVVVGTGASLGVFPVNGQTVTIDGNIIADQCNSVAIQTFGDGVFSVGGNVNIQNCTGPVNGYSGIRVTIGGNFLCANSGVCVAGDGVVQGNLTMDNNNAVSEVDDNQIGGNVDVSGNSGSAPKCWAIGSAAIFNALITTRLRVTLASQTRSAETNEANASVSSVQIQSDD